MCRHGFLHLGEGQHAAKIRFAAKHAGASRLQSEAVRNSRRRSTIYARTMSTCSISKIATRESSGARKRTFSILTATNWRSTPDRAPRRPESKADLKNEVRSPGARSLVISDSRVASRTVDRVRCLYPSALILHPFLLSRSCRAPLIAAGGAFHRIAVDAAGVLRAAGAEADLIAVKLAGDL